MPNDYTPAAEKVALAHGGCMAAATDAEHLCSLDCVPEPPAETEGEDRG